MCPKCGMPGSGPYIKETWSTAGGPHYKRYRYFAHKVKNQSGKWETQWCYLGSAEAIEEPKPNEEKLSILNRLKKALRGR